MTLSGHDFIDQCREFVERCEKYGDIWTLREKREDGELLDALVCSFSDLAESKSLLLTKVEQRRVGDKLLSYEYNVIHSESYGVPVMYFHVSDQDGCPIPINQIVSIESSDLSKVVNQVEHPLLFRPFYMIHPCRTEDFMREHHSTVKRGYLISWLSIVGTLIGLKLDNRLAQSV